MSDLVGTQIVGILTIRLLCTCNLCMFEFSALVSIILLAKNLLYYIDLGAWCSIGVKTSLVNTDI